LILGIPYCCRTFDDIGTTNKLLSFKFSKGTYFAQNASFEPPCFEICSIVWAMEPWKKYKNVQHGCTVVQALAFFKTVLKNAGILGHT